MTDFYFLPKSFIYLLLAVEYAIIEWQIPPINPFPNINSISISVGNSNFTPIFFKTACHANPGDEKHFAGSSS